MNLLSADEKVHDLRIRKGIVRNENHVYELFCVKKTLRMPVIQKTCIVDGDRGRITSWLRTTNYACMIL